VTRSRRMQSAKCKMCRVIRWRSLWRQITDAEAFETQRSQGRNQKAFERKDATRQNRNQKLSPTSRISTFGGERKEGTTANERQWTLIERHLNAKTQRRKGRKGQKAWAVTFANVEDFNVLVATGKRGQTANERQWTLIEDCRFGVFSAIGVHWRSLAFIRGFIRGFIRSTPPGLRFPRGQRKWRDLGF